MPLGLDLLRCRDVTRLLAEDMRMPSNEFGRDVARHIIDIPGRCGVLLRDAGMEDDLQKQIPQLLTQVVASAGLDRLHRLVGLLEQVLDEAVMRLPCIPRAPAGRTQSVHHRDEFDDTVPGLGHGVSLGSRDQLGERIDCLYRCRQVAGKRADGERASVPRAESRTHLHTLLDAEAGDVLHDGLLLAARIRVRSERGTEALHLQGEFDLSRDPTEWHVRIEVRRDECLRAAELRLELLLRGVDLTLGERDTLG